MSKKQDFINKGFDIKTYERYYHQNQNDYIRIRLRSIKLYNENHSFAAVALALNIDERSVRKNVNSYLSDDYDVLTKRTTRKQPTLLTESQEQEFKLILLKSHPREHGYNSNIWTGPLMIDYLKKHHKVTYKSGIYDLLDRLNLTHQPELVDFSLEILEEQDVFEKISDTAPKSSEKSTNNGWSEKKTRRKIKTNEKK